MSKPYGKIEQDVEGFRKIVSESRTFSEAMRKIGIKPNGGNYKYFNKKIKKYNINISHFIRMYKKINISEDLVKKEIKNSNSLVNLAERIGMKDASNTTIYRHLKKIIEKHRLDISHFTGMLWSKGKTRFNDDRLKKSSEIRRNSSWDSTFCKDSDTNTHSSIIIEMLVERKIKKYKCEICGLYEWKSVPIRLHLDHINGDNCDNRIENLRFLCPNCHSQTETYCRGNNKNNSNNFNLWYKNMLILSSCAKTIDRNENVFLKVTECRKLIGRVGRKKIKFADFGMSREVLTEKIKNSSCKKVSFEINVSYKLFRKICREENILIPDSRSEITEARQIAIERHRKFHINKEELEKLVKDNSMLALGRMFNVSGNAVKKRCKFFGIDWRKKKTNNGSVVKLENTQL